MPEVSVVIAAYRPDYLDLAIASALAQTFGDFELLISDDSDGDDVAAVVEKWTDPRILYTRNPRKQQPGTNRDHLIELASGTYIKFLWDDDFLYPQSLEVLVRLARSCGAQLAFHHRTFVDAVGRPEPSYAPLQPGEMAQLDAATVFRSLVTGNPYLLNVIGEPTNILVEAQCLRSMPNPFGLGNRRVRFLDDVALYLNMAARGHTVVGVGVALSAFRHHQTQMSAANSATWSSGLYEWELVARWSADAGRITREECIGVLQRLRALYAQRVDEFPELTAFLALEVRPDADGRFLVPELDAALDAANSIVDERKRVPDGASPLGAHTEPAGV